MKTWTEFLLNLIQIQVYTKTNMWLHGFDGGVLHPSPLKKSCPCNTPGVTVAATVHLQYPLQCLYSSCYSTNLIQERWCFLILKIGSFEVKLESLNFSNSYALWIIKVSLKIFGINWSWFRPHFQNGKCFSQLVLQVCKSEKIIDLVKYLF
jgi:hypothetical protein